ncbi:MAG: cytochrome c [Cyanobacteria bacterium J06641_5]
MTGLPKTKIGAVRGEEAADEQPILGDIPVGRLLLTLAAIAIVVASAIAGVRLHQLSDPYVRDVLTLQGTVAQGEAIFQINCAGCHGVTADGNVGPSLHEISRRKSKLGIIHQVTDGRTPPMPKFQPAPQEMADLLAYLKSV